jgi:hypothetical protein
MNEETRGTAAAKTAALVLLPAVALILLWRKFGPGEPGTADRPVIMTGGSLTVWSVASLQHVQQGSEHVYIRDVEPIRLISVHRRGMRTYLHRHPAGVEVWYKATGDVGDVKVFSGTIRVRAADPLIYRGVKEVAITPGGGGNEILIDAHRFDHADDTTISNVRVWMNQQDYYEYGCNADSRPRVQIHY